MFEDSMFADSMLETSWAQRARRCWTTLTSFGLQVLILGLLLLLPLWKTVGLPVARSVSTPVSLGRADPTPARPQDHVRSSGVQIIPYAGRIMAPGRVPDRIAKGDDAATPPIGAIGGPGGGDLGHDWLAQWFSDAAWRHDAPAAGARCRPLSALFEHQAC